MNPPNANPLKDKEKEHSGSVMNDGWVDFFDLFFTSGNSFTRVIGCAMFFFFVFERVCVRGVHDTTLGAKI